MTAHSLTEQEPALFPLPAAYQPSAWTYVPNAQDAARPVELDEDEPRERRCAARTPATPVRVPGRLPVVGETARAS